MSFQCFICEQKFKRLQDRAAHIRLKKDDAHRQFFLDQEQNILLHFSETVQQRSHIPTHNSSLLPPALEVLSVQINDVDIGDLPSSRDMDIDQEDGSCLESDDDGSIASEEMGRVEDIEDLKNEAILSRSVDATARALLEDFNFTELAEIFDFIPDPDLDIVLEEGVTDLTHPPQCTVKRVGPLLMTTQIRELTDGIQLPEEFTGESQRFMLVGNHFLGKQEVNQVLRMHRLAVALSGSWLNGQSKKKFLRSLLTGCYVFPR